MKKIFAFFFYTLLCGNFLWAQGTELYHNLSIEQGLSDVSVNAIAQDKYGYIWLGTSNGLNRYDGYSIKTFYADSYNNLTSNNIVALHSDADGRLWVGTSRGLVEYDFKTEAFIRRIDSSILGYNFIYCLIEDAKKNIYIGANSGVYYYDKTTALLSNISAQYAPKFNIARVKGLSLFDANTLYVSTEKMGFFKLNLKEKQGQQFTFKMDVPLDSFLHTNELLRLDDSTLLLGTLSVGVIKFNTRTHLFSWPAKPGALYRNPAILYNTVRKCTRDHNNRIWVASHYFGLAEYFPGQDSIAIPAVQPYTPYSFEGRSAQCVFEDRQHNLWIGTSRNGVYRFRPNQKSAYFYAQNEFDPSALQRGAVISIVPIDAENLMVGTANGPSFYNKQNNSFVNYKGQAHYAGRQALEQATCALKDRLGNVWVGSNRLGLMKFSAGFRTLDVFTRFEKIPVQADGVTKILPFNKDTLIMVNFGSISLLNIQTVQTKSHHNDSVEPLLQIKGIADMCTSNDSAEVWIARSNGDLFRYHFENHLLQKQAPVFDTFSSPLILYKINMDEKGRLWCATNFGALCVQNGKLTKVITLKGNKNPTEITNLLPVGDELWLTNSRTLARYNIRTDRMTVLGQKNGFKDIKLYAASLAVSPWGTIMIGGSNGFFEIFPDKIVEDSSSLPAFLTSFKIYDQHFKGTAIISEAKRIDLNPKQNSFSFDMSTFDFNEANDIEYAYMLEGFEENWHFIGTKRNGSYTNIPGGSYTLRLKAKNSSGVWNENGQSLQIIIAKPFWQTYWFMGLVLATVVGSVIVLYRFRINAFKRREKLRRDYEIKLNELENSALRTQMNPHFIFNSLNTINSFINSNNSTKANQYISKFSRLIRMILDHSREKKIPLADELRVAELYIQLEKIRFNNKFQHQVIIEDELDVETIVIPPLIIQPFIENAILHGLLPSDKEGMLSIFISRQNKLLFIVIEDNGIGRARAMAMKKHEDSKRKSHGIDITIKRIALFNNEPYADQTIQIIDLINEEGTAVGTRVEIPIKLEESF